MKILVVDDSAVMRKVIISSLEKMGVKDCGQACDGREAVAAVMKGKYSLVLMDWNMPNMLGIDAVRAIRAGGSQVPIIMVTTEAEKARVIEALKSGANNYIIKPFKPEKLIDKLKQTLAKRKAN